MCRVLLEKLSSRPQCPLVCRNEVEKFLSLESCTAERLDKVCELQTKLFRREVNEFQSSQLLGSVAYCPWHFAVKAHFRKYGIINWELQFPELYVSKSRVLQCVLDARFEVHAVYHVGLFPGYVAVQNRIPESSVLS